ncbi:MAG: TraB/GumN family protein [Phenylobacterium sp.]
MRTLAAGLAAGAALLVALPAAAAPAMFVVRDADSEIFLFGTMHALPADAAWRTPAYDAAYAQAQSVWFEAEADEASPAAMNDLIARYGVSPDRPLSARLNKRQLKNLKTVLARSGRTLDQVDHLRPWAAALALSMQPCIQAKQSVETGADAVVTRQARQAEKPIRAFETLEDQVRMFATLPEAVELKYLTDVVDEQLGRGAATGALSDVWISGDLRRLGRRVADPIHAKSPGFYAALVTRRNRAWAEALTAQMAGKGVELVNVGALHLLGQDGLPALMRSRGFTVERVQ